MLQGSKFFNDNKQMGQSESEATFFSRSSNSLRSTFDLRRSRISLITSALPFMRCRFNRISSVFLPACSYMPSNLLCMPGMASKAGLNSALMASIRGPTSVRLNLPSFLGCFFITHIIVRRGFLVKHIFSEIRQGTMGDVAEMMALSPMVIDSAKYSSSVVSAVDSLSINSANGVEKFSTSSNSIDAYAMPQPNDVVMMDRSGGIRLADTPNSTQVIGVVSVNPAQILREGLPFLPLPFMGEG